MSKRRRKNRPRNRPSNRPKQSTNNPEISVVDHIRRKLILGGTAGAILGVLGYNILKDGKTPEQTVQERTSKKTEVKPKNPEYQEWASKIKLPDIQIDNQVANLTYEEKIDKFLPKNVDREKLDKFYKDFDEIVNKLISDYEKAENDKTRDSTITLFLANLHERLMKDFEQFRKPDFYKNANSLSKIVKEMMKFLLPHGFWFRIDSLRGKGWVITLYKIDTIKNLNINTDGNHVEVPIIFLKDKKIFTPDPESETSPFVASFVDDAKYITMDLKTLQDRIPDFLKNLEEMYQEKPLSIKVPSKDNAFKISSDFMIKHEGIHATLDLIFKVNPGRQKIKRRGNINMGKYRLLEDLYSQFDLEELHELAAYGYQFMHSNVLVAQVLIDMISNASVGGSFRTGYALASYVAQVEILHLLPPERFYEFEYKFRSKKLTMQDISDAVTSVHPRELHRIGEGMAKLGFYLTQK